MLIYILLSFVLSLFIGMIVMPRILLVSYKKRLFDNPSLRKVHKMPVPRLGGLAFMPVILIAISLVMGLRYEMGVTILSAIESHVFVNFCAFVAGIMMLYMIGVKDDLVGVNYKSKFFIQILAGILFPLLGLWINSLYGFLGIHDIPAWLGMPLTVFLCVYVTNAINLIDGIDGLASGLSLIGFFVVGMCQFNADMYVYCILAASAVGVLLPFLYYNLHKNNRRNRKIFMGDTGSLTLGYLMTFLFLQLAMKHESFPVDYSGNIFVAFGALVIPLFDVVRVVFSRSRDGRPLFKPDMNHIHHKCIRTGMNARQTMVFLLVLSLFFVFVNWMLVRYLWANVIFVDILVWMLIHLVLNRFIHKEEQRTGKTWNRKYGRYTD